MVFLHKNIRIIDKKTTSLLKKLKSMNESAKIICCNNADKSKTIEKIVQIFKEIGFEFMSPGTPQQNDILEWGFATLYSRMRIILAHAVIH